MRKSRIDDSARKALRPIKIELPTKTSTMDKKTPSDRRSVSEDRGFRLKKSSLVPPPIYLIRSTSATRMETPIRTPTTPNLGTTSKKTPLHTKNLFGEQLGRIFSYIGCIEGVNKNFVASKNIKLMSIKDFLAIVCHLSKFWMPEKLTVNRDYADDIYNMLCKLRYPYKISKRKLMTPNAPHVLNDAIILIAWLLDGVPDTSLDSSDDLVEIPGFPTTTYAKHFQSRVRDAYKLCHNNQDQEAAEVRLDLLNKYIMESVAYSSEEELQKEIASLMAKCEALEVEANNWEAEQQKMQNLQKQVDERKKQLEAIRGEIMIKSMDNEMYTVKFASDEQTMKKLLAKKETVEKEWQQQKQENRSALHEQLLICLHEANIILQSSVEHSDNVKEIGLAVQMDRYRLLKKLHDLTNESNLIVDSVLRYRPAGMEVEDLTLEPKHLDGEKIAKIHETLREIQQQVSCEIQKNNMEIISLKNTIEFGVSRDIDRHEKSLQNLTEQFIELESTKAKFISTSEHNKATLDRQIEAAEKKKLTLDQSVEETKEQIRQEKMKQQEIREILKKFSDDADEQLKQEFEEKLDELQKKLDHFNLRPDVPPK